jgi:probable F420-dependent oxidoreductase
MAADEVRGKLGRVGVWLMDVLMERDTTLRVERAQVARIEELGYRSFWFHEGVGGRDAFAHAAILLSATDRIVIAPGIATIAARHPGAMHGAAATLAEAFPGRFLLGMGAGWAPRAATRMTEYLDAMDVAATEQRMPSVPPLDTPYLRVLAALGPRMLRMARDRGDGAHPFAAPVEHTAAARAALGPDRLLIPEQAVAFDVDPARARSAARAAVARGLAIANSPYTANLRRLGYDDHDFADGGSDRLVDAKIARGDAEMIAAHVRRQFDAGADHVLLHPLGSDLKFAVDVLEHLAPALLEPQIR